MTAELRISVVVVAAHLGVAKDSFYRWNEQKNLPAHRVGQPWTFKLTEIDEWVREGGAAQESALPRRGGDEHWE